MSAYAKLIAGIVGVLATWIADYFSARGITMDGAAISQAVIQILMLAGIYQLPNTPAPPSSKTGGYT